MHLFKPRDGYRTRVSPSVLGPTIDYYLPAAPAGPVTIEILDATGAIVNTYNSDAPAGGGGGGGRGGRGGGAQAARRAGRPPPMHDEHGAAGSGAGGGGGGRGWRRRRA